MFHGIVATSPDAIISINNDMRITVFNRVAEKLYGYTRAEVMGERATKLIPERFWTWAQEAMRQVAAGRTGAWSPRRDILCLRRTGEEFSAEATISKLVIGDEPMLTIVLRDVTELRRIEREKQLHAELAETFSGDPDLKNRLAAISQLLSRDMADVCVVDFVDEDNTIRCAHVACRDPAKQAVRDALWRRRLSSEHTSTELSFDAAGEVVIQSVTPELIGSWASSEPDRAILENAGFTSAIVAPLHAHGRLLGVITLLAVGSPQRYGQADARMVETFAQRAALFLDNARLFAAAMRATRLRDEMLGVVAHDLRNPLAAILTLAAVLRKTGTEDEIVTEIEHAARRMSRLI